MTSRDDIIVKDPEIMGGAPVFRGTRVPLKGLFDYLEGGQTLEEFLDNAPLFRARWPSRRWSKLKQKEEICNGSA